MKKMSKALVSAFVAMVMAATPVTSTSSTAFADTGSYEVNLTDYEIAQNIGTELEAQLVHTIQPASVNVRRAEEAILDSVGGDIRELYVYGTLVDAFPELFARPNSLHYEMGTYHAEIDDFYVSYLPSTMDYAEVSGSRYELYGENSELNVKVDFEMDFGYHVQVSYDDCDPYIFTIESDDIADEGVDDTNLGTYILTTQSAAGVQLSSPTDLGILAILTEFAHYYSIGMPQDEPEHDVDYLDDTSEDPECVLGPPIAINPVMSLECDVDDVAEYVVEELFDADLGLVNREIEHRLDAGEDIRLMCAEEFVDWRNLTLHDPSSYVRAEYNGTHVFYSGQSFNKFGYLSGGGVYIVDVPAIVGSGYTTVEVQAKADNEYWVSVSRYTKDGHAIDSTYRTISSFRSHDDAYYTIPLRDTDDTFMSSDEIAILKVLVGLAYAQ